MFGIGRTAKLEEAAPRRPEIIGSARSKRSLLRERTLRAALARLIESKQRGEEQLRKAEDAKARISRQIVADSGPFSAINRVGAERNLGEAVVQAETARSIIAAHDEEIAKLQESIDQLVPSPEQLEARREQQSEMAVLAEERLSIDRGIDASMRELRRILLERGQVTAKMQAISEVLDLSTDLDGGRFDLILRSLPGDQSEASEQWLAWFLGKEIVPIHVVLEKSLTTGETLVDHGVHSFGDEIRLSSKEACELLREDRLDPTAKGRVFISPSVMSAEKYNRLEEAGGAGAAAAFALEKTRQANAETARRAEELQARLDREQRDSSVEF